MLRLMLGEAADSRPAASWAQPAFNITLLAQNAAAPDVRNTVTLYDVKLENWVGTWPEDDFLMESRLSSVPHGCRRGVMSPQRTCSRVATRRSRSRFSEILRPTEGAGNGVATVRLEAAYRARPATGIQGRQGAGLAHRHADGTARPVSPR